MEIWKAVHDPYYKRYYEVSSHGRVRNKLTGRLPKRMTYRQTRLYPPFVYLSRNKKRKHYSVAELVANAFIGPGSEDQILRHKDGDRFNNQVNNLQWGFVRA